MAPRSLVLFPAIADHLALRGQIWLYGAGGGAEATKLPFTLAIQTLLGQLGAFMGNAAPAGSSMRPASPISANSSITTSRSTCLVARRRRDRRQQRSTICGRRRSTSISFTGGGRRSAPPLRFSATGGAGLGDQVPAKARTRNTARRSAARPAPAGMEVQTEFDVPRVSQSAQPGGCRPTPRSSAIPATTRT